MIEIEYLPIEYLKPYTRNAKKHPREQIEQIKKSIREFGFNDPIAIWHEDEIIEGHGRLLAVMEMDEIDEVPVIRLDSLTDEQRRAYMLVHNKLTMNSDFDTELLMSELDDIFDIDMDDFGFDVDQEEPAEEKYTNKVEIPQYEPSDTEWAVGELYDPRKAERLLQEIEEAELPEDIKVFLTMASYRHVVFNYKRIADFYARADYETQRLMEKSALVIIDYDDAIRQGYVDLHSGIEELIENEE